ncbi:MAG: excalibur calcium-binding protein, partial [Actinomycetota bacterium]|nr:excalibur calcium-binding protein [Actinomycetota bacterium]
MRRIMLLATLCAALVLALAPTAMAQTNQFNCPDFEFQEDAQAVYNQDTSDPNLLDEDAGPDDGIACENLPSRGTGTGATGSQYTQQPTATQYAPTTPAEAVDEETS